MKVGLSLKKFVNRRPPLALTGPTRRFATTEQSFMAADLKFEDIVEEVAGVYPKIMKTGDMDAGAWSCGMVAGLIHDKPTVKNLIDDIMAEADAIINQRLKGL